MLGKHQVEGTPNSGAPASALNTMQLSARWRPMLTPEQWRTVLTETGRVLGGRRRLTAVAQPYGAIAEVRFIKRVGCGLFQDLEEAMHALPEDPISRAECLLLALEFTALTTEDLECPPVGTRESFVIAALEDLQGAHPAVRERLAALGAPDWLEVKRRLAGPELSAWLQALAEKRQRPLRQ